MPRVDRDKLHRQLLTDLREFSQEYRTQAAKAADEICRRYERSKKKSVNVIIKEVLAEAALSSDCPDVILRAMAHGYGVAPEVVVDNDIIRRDVMNRVWTGDGMTLSERLYANRRETERLVREAIMASNARGDALIKTARKLYDGYGHESVIPQAKLPEYLARVEREAHVALAGGDLAEFKKALAVAKGAVKKLKPSTPLRAAYRQMLDAAQTGKPNALERAVRVALEEKSRYHAERIARTEAARAYYDGFMARNMNDPDVVAFKWELSSGHPKPDICDTYAEQDLYGLGAGVYPKDKLPALPAHPHCLCHISEVYEGEVKGYKKPDKAAGAPTSRVEAGEIEKPKAKLLTNAKFDETVVKMMDRRREKYERKALAIGRKYRLIRNMDGSLKYPTPEAIKAEKTVAKLNAAAEKLYDRKLALFAERTKTGQRLANAFTSIANERDRNDVIWALKDAPDGILSLCVKHGDKLKVETSALVSSEAAGHYNYKKGIAYNRDNAGHLGDIRHEVGHFLDDMLSGGCGGFIMQATSWSFNKIGPHGIKAYSEILRQGTADDIVEAVNKSDFAHRRAIADLFDAISGGEIQGFRDAVHGKKYYEKYEKEWPGMRWCELPSCLTEIFADATIDKSERDFLEFYMPDVVSAYKRDFGL